MTERSTTVTAPLQSGIVRDATTAILTSRRFLVIWAIALVVLVIGIVLVSSSGPRNETLFPVIAPIVFAVVLVLGTRRSVLRTVSGALPVGSTVGAEVGERSLRLRTAQGTADVAYASYSGVVAQRSVVLLRLRNSSILTSVPRELVDADDLARIRGRIAATAQ